MSNDSTDKVWNEKPELIRHYYELLPRHERLCEEIEYILSSRLKEGGIEVAHTTSRVKSLSSFCEKLQRKNYLDPISQITDLVGVRIVFLYISDISVIEELIEKEFKVIEKENKLESNEEEKFGYGALHYLIKIKRKHSGARYDDLRNLVCEIQVRTILQDAWSIVAHHLSYKQEADVPKNLLRKLNALSGLFETADDQFERLRIARSNYIEKIENDISSSLKKSLAQPINLDNLIAYTSTKFPDRKESSAEATAELLEELKMFGYKKLSDLDDAINKGLSAALKEEKNKPPLDRSTSKNINYANVGIIRIILSLVDESYCLEKYNETRFEQAKKYGLMGDKDA